MIRGSISSFSNRLCKELSISQDEYHDLLNQVRSVSLLSYDDLSHFSKSDKRALHGVGDGHFKTPTPFSEVNVAYIKKMMAEAIQDLPEKQRLVLSLYYYVSQLHTQAILRLKSKLRNHWDDFLVLLG